MKIKIEIDLNNAAFQPGPGMELSRILGNLADRIQFWSDAGKILDPFKLTDSNGNTVGKGKVVK